MKKLYGLIAILIVVALVVPTADMSLQSVGKGNVAYAQDNPTEITFWHFWGSPVRRTAVRRVIALCEQQMGGNVKVTEVFKPFGDIWTANIAAVAAGSGMPDVIVEDRPQLPRIAADGIEQSLQPYIERDQFDTSVFWPFTWEQTLYEGESYGIPFETDVRVLFYNKNLLQEAGFDAPPQTWEELWAYADALDKYDENGNLTRMGFFPLYGNVGMDVWAMTNGHNWVQDGKPVVDDPAVLETMEWLQRWVDRYGGWEKVQAFLAQFGAPPNDVFMSNGVVMFVDVAGYHSTLSFYRPTAKLADETTPRMEWGAGLIPYNKEPATTSGGFALSIPVGAEHPDEAWEFIKCATSYDAVASWSRDTYAMPTVQAVAEDPILSADPLWPFFVDALQYSKVLPYVPEYSNWWGDIVANSLEDVWAGFVSPEDMVKDAQEQIDASF